MVCSKWLQQLAAHQESMLKSVVVQEDSSTPVRENGNPATQDSESLGSDSSEEEGDADAERSFGVRTGIKT